MKKILLLLASLTVIGVVVSAAQANPPANGHEPVTICHKPDGANPITIVVDDDSVLAAHIRHGDSLGPCPPTNPPPPPPPGDDPPPPGNPPCYGGPNDGGKDGVAGNDACVPDQVIPPPSSPPSLLAACPAGTTSMGIQSGVLVCLKTETETQVVTKVKVKKVVKWKTRVVTKYKKGRTVFKLYCPKKKTYPVAG